jgi:predicted acyl esterase
VPSDQRIATLALSKSVAQNYLDWPAHPDYDDYWKQWSIEEHFSDITVPMLQVGGSYDLFKRDILMPNRLLIGRQWRPEHVS